MKKIIGVVSKVYNLFSTESGYMELTFGVEILGNGEHDKELFLMCRYGTKDFAIIESIKPGVKLDITGKIEVRNFKVRGRIACGPILEITQLVVQF
ncbi:MAG: hypothetical protein P4L51_01765 [Puia sp.]|nr:hypothetical protein [Puia sp.]